MHLVTVHPFGPLYDEKTKQEEKRPVCRQLPLQMLRGIWKDL